MARDVTAPYRTSVSPVLMAVFLSPGFWHPGSSQREIQVGGLLCESDLPGAGLSELRPVPALRRGQQEMKWSPAPFPSTAGPVTAGQAARTALGSSVLTHAAAVVNADTHTHTCTLTYCAEMRRPSGLHRLRPGAASTLHRVAVSLPWPLGPTPVRARCLAPRRPTALVCLISVTVLRPNEEHFLFSRLTKRLFRRPCLPLDVRWRMHIIACVCGCQSEREGENSHLFCVLVYLSVISSGFSL